MAMIAEHEREAISARTKAALAAAKRRGVKLGTPRNLTNRARRIGTRKSAGSREAQAMQRAKDLAATITEVRSNGATSLREIARDLDERDIPTPRGGRWTAAQVRRLLHRIDRMR